MIIHKEGRSFLLGLSLVMIATLGGLHFLMVPKEALFILYLLFGSLFLFCLQFFRNPGISIAQNPKYVLAPADGKVVVIEETEETEYLKEVRVQISIFMSPIDKHINRNPVSGTIKYLKYHVGKYLVAWHPKASTDNERTTIVYELPGGLQILVRQIAGAMARRIKYYIDMDDSVQQGEEFGFIKFGSRVDVFLPADAKILVEKDQKTVGGITVLAEFA
jgi:phosphatidylserine decarboxylase